MFTGIIESVGIIDEVSKKGSNTQFWIRCPITAELKPDQSLCHDGVCLTVEEISGDKYKVSAIDETLKKTNLTDWKEGQKVNLERSMQLNGRFDGHIVQGHIDTTASCIEKYDRDGSHEFVFEFSKEFSTLLVEKGSTAVNGVSLTVFDVRKNQFTVGIIPFTFNHTNFCDLQVGNKVNLEFDIIGKYIQRIAQR